MAPQFGSKIAQKLSNHSTTAAWEQNELVDKRCDHEHDRSGGNTCKNVLIGRESINARYRDKVVVPGRKSNFLETILLNE